jgi:hypothetical protein
MALGLCQMSGWCHSFAPAPVTVHVALIFSHARMLFFLLQVNSGGAGPVSAEWMVPKALWLFQEEPDTFKVGHTAEDATKSDQNSVDCFAMRRLTGWTLAGNQQMSSRVERCPHMLPACGGCVAAP